MKGRKHYVKHVALGILTAAFLGNALTLCTFATIAKADDNIGTTAEPSVPTAEDQNQVPDFWINPISFKTYGDAPFRLSVSGLHANAAGTVIYHSSNPNILSIDGDVATILGAGNVTVSATYNYHDQSYPAKAPISFSIYTANLTVTANDLGDVPYGTAIPQLTYHVNGLVGEDTFSNPKIWTEATDTSAPGTYDIVISGGTLSNPNYDITYRRGVVVIVNRSNAEKSSRTKTPTENTPATVTPTENTPIGIAPAENTPTATPPTQNISASTTPTENASATATSAENTPTAISSSAESYAEMNTSAISANISPKTADHSLFMIYNSVLLSDRGLMIFMATNLCVTVFLLILLKRT